MGYGNDLNDVLSAAREIGENLKKELELFKAENAELKNKIEELSAENSSLRESYEMLRNANKDFGENLNAWIINLNKSVNESHSKFMDEINNLMRKEFREFFSGYVKKVDDTPPPSENSQTSGAIVVQSENQVERAEETPEQKPKMMYAAFYAEETRPENPENVHNLQMNEFKRIGG